MKAQTEAFLDKAQELLRNATTMRRVGLDAHAGRTAYLSGCHAAQALIFEKTGRVFKTHKGVQGEFGRLTREDPRFTREFRAFLGRAYGLKTVADYESGPARPSPRRRRTRRSPRPRRSSSISPVCSATAMPDPAPRRGGRG